MGERRHERRGNRYYIDVQARVSKKLLEAAA